MLSSKISWFNRYRANVINIDGYWNNTAFKSYKTYVYRSKVDINLPSNVRYVHCIYMHCVSVHVKQMTTQSRYIEPILEWLLKYYIIQAMYTCYIYRSKVDINLSTTCCIFLHCETVQVQEIIIQEPAAFWGR
jgi:hypothetical protein